MAELNVVSVCRVLPTPDNRSAGQFVIRRIAGMARHARVRALQPVPCFPCLRPLPSWLREPTRQESGVTVDSVPMLYVPGVLKSLDGRWLSRAITPALDAARRVHPRAIVDAHFGYPEGVGCVRSARRLGMPVFVTLRGLEIDRLRTQGIASQLRDALNAANGCIAVSHSLKDAVVAAGVREEQVRVIHNAVDRGVFKPGSREAARRRLGLPADQTLLVSVGNMVALKRHTVLVEALARLRRGRAVRLAILGGGDAEPGYQARVEALAREFGVAEQLLIVGRVSPEAVVDWLQASNAFVLATSREGCCNAVLEALACGIPVVTTPAGDNARFIRPGRNGFLAPVDDADAVAARIGEALDRGQWDATAVSASLTVGDWDQIGRQVIDYFSERLVA